MKNLIKKTFSTLLLSVISILIFYQVYGQVKIREYSLSPQVFLPDGKEFKIWQMETKFSKTYYVDQNNTKASDTNSGTQDIPFKTIGKAAELLQPGEKVIVKEGIYREWVIPHFGGEGPDKMISYEAAEGEKVIIKGSEIIDPKSWKKDSYKPLGPLSRFLQFDLDTSVAIWSVKLPRSWFDGYNPFAMINRNQLAQEVVRRANPESSHSFSVEDLSTTLLKRGLVFQNGERLKQVSHTAYMNAEQGTYWVESNGLELFVRPFGDIKPSDAIFEVTVREFLFAPENHNLGYIQVKGFEMEHAGNGWPLWPSGALSANGGHHWIIEENMVRQVNAIGIDVGSHDEDQSYLSLDECHIIRNNEISDCGISGIAGVGLRKSLVEKNHVHHCAWHRIEKNFENAGIKFHHVKSSLIRKNLVHDITEAAGIWLDAGIENSRVAQNLIYNVETGFGGIFIEISRLNANLIDHNIVLNIDGNGIYEHDCDRLIICHNLIAGCSGYGIRLKKGEAARFSNGRGSTGRKHQVYNNIITNTGRFLEFPNPDQKSDYNLFGHFIDPGPFRMIDNNEYLDFPTWKEFYGFDQNSMESKFIVTFNEIELELELKFEGSIPHCEKIKYILNDYFDNSLINSKSINPGPFSNLEKKNVFLINPINQ